MYCTAVEMCRGKTGKNVIADYEVQNFSIMSEYVTEMGRMKHSRDTGLRPRNQRKMAKAVRRAIGLGLIPSTYRHPEILKTELAYRRGLGRD